VADGREGSKRFFLKKEAKTFIHCFWPLCRILLPEHRLAEGQARKQAVPFLKKRTQKTFPIRRSRCLPCAAGHHPCEPRQPWRGRTVWLASPEPAARWPRFGTAQRIKVFCFFFSKKKRLLASDSYFQQVTK
jgi:hypothetical protein